ncbi:hypothetical protein HAX54_004715 [Datura stramonium]|uniref:Uncharacterized protein n=1 Tax=Datura stramonium TaxID=4076 RepID=A0ABS8T860_DATST|nr:hypothetical protein [Datura stramonium]
MERRCQQYCTKVAAVRLTRTNCSLQEKKVDTLWKYKVLHYLQATNCIKMASIVIPAAYSKEYVQCVESKFLTPSYTNRAMYNVDMVGKI